MLFRLLLICLSFCFLHAETPTERFLQTHPFDRIQEVMQDEDNFDRNVNLFFKIIENEKAPGFLGYHGSSQKFRIYQDILRAVFEEILKLPLPQDFHFFRLPGAPEYDLVEGSQTYFDMIDPKEITQENQKFIVQFLLLNPINESFQTRLKAEDFTTEELTVLLKPLMAYRDFMNKLVSGDSMNFYKSLAPNPEKEKMKEEILKKLKAGPTAEIKKKVISKMVDYKWSKDKPPVAKFSFVHDMDYIPHSPFAEELAPIFMAKGVPADILNWLHLRLDFNTIFTAHFQTLVTPTDEEYDKINCFIFPYWDHRKGQQERVISMNFTLFGNYNNLGESSLYMFLSSHTMGSGDSHAIESLRAFFHEVGLPQPLAEKLYEKGKKQLSKRDEGCVYQFFDQTPDRSLTNNYAYTSAPFGIPYKAITPREIIEGSQPLFTPSGQTYQLRLLMANDKTLNPFSTLKIKRYDIHSPATAKKLMDTFRDELKHTKVIQAKKEAYVKKIKKMWKLDGKYDGKREK